MQDDGDATAGVGIFARREPSSHQGIQSNSDIHDDVTTVSDDTTIPIVEETARIEKRSVEKRFVLEEEVHIRQTTSGEDVAVPVTLRRQHAVIEESSADGES